MGARIGVWLLGALAPATVLAVDPAGWFPFGPGKWLVLTVLLPAGAALVLGSGPLRVPRPLALAAGALVLAMALAAAVGLDPLYAWVGTPERHLGVLAWLLAAVALAVGCSLTPGHDGSALLVGLTVAAWGVGAVSTAEALGWEPAVLDVGSRLTGPFGSSAYLGAATALLLPVMVGVACDERAHSALRWAAGAALPLLAVACLGSGARAAWAALLVALAVGVAARWRTVRAHARTSGAVAAGAAVIVVVLAALTPVGDRAAALTDPDSPGGRGRLDEWRVASSVLGDHLLTGVGPEGYRVAFAAGVDARYEREHGRDPHPDRAHSAPLDVALAGGLPALAAWLAVVVLVGRHVLRALRSGPPWLAGLAAGLLAHLAGQLLLFPVVELELVAWLLAGLVVAATPDAPARRLRLPRPVPVVLGAVALVGLLAGVTGVAADRAARRAVDALARGDHAAAATAAVDAADLRPDVVRLHVLAARARVADEQGTLAGIEQLERALDVSPGDPIVLRDRLELLVARAAATRVPAHMAAAREELDRLLARDPHSRASWRQAEILAEVEGDEEAAAEARKRGEELTPPDQRGD